MNHMNYRRLGRTGLKVSEVSLGTVELGLEYGISDGRPLRKPSRADAARLLNVALDAGINFIDTARAYGDSEEVIGWALKPRRNEYVLASKVPCRWREDEKNTPLRDRITASVHASLRALQTGVIDLMQLHSPQAEDIRRGEMADVLQGLQKAGCIRFLGVTTYGEESALAALEDGRYDCIQIAYSALDRESEMQTLPLAQAKDVGVVARSVLLKGSLTYRYRYLPSELEELRCAAGKIAALAEAGSFGLPELAYRFVLAHPAVSSALVGTASIDELKAALEYCARGPLPPDWQARVRQITINDQRQLNPSTWPIR